MQRFLNSEAGAQYASTWNPAWKQIVPSAGGATPGQWFAGGDARPEDPSNPNAGNLTSGATNVTALYNAYTNWLNGQNETSANWQAYQQAVNGSQGGEGDNTTLTGDAVSQRNQLLGANSSASLGLGNVSLSPRLGTGK
jgi:hypothetical protein